MLGLLPLLAAPLVMNGAAFLSYAPPSPVRAAAETRTVAYAPAHDGRDVRAMLAALNARRVSRHLAPLALDERLSSVALAHAIDMATHAFVGHTSSDGANPFERLDRASVRYAYAGENVALDESVASAESALWYSPEHRDNILEPHYARVGIAAVAVADGEIFVEDFSD